MSIRNGCGNLFPPFWYVTAIPFPLQMGAIPMHRTHCWEGPLLRMSMGGPSTSESYKTEQRIHLEVIFYEVYCPFCWSSSCQAYAIAFALDLCAHRLCRQQSVAHMLYFSYWCSLPMHGCPNHWLWRLSAAAVQLLSTYPAAVQGVI